jgi:DNA-binding transcriptional LysR family regulator
MTDAADLDVKLGVTSTSAIDLRHLRYAVAAADHGSFRRAAEAMRLQQSKLSRCIRQLEYSIGLIIFDRSSGGVQATIAGREFLRTARSILGQIEALVKNTQSTGSGKSGKLSVGFYTSLSAGNLRATLVDYQRAGPGNLHRTISGISA